MTPAEFKKMFRVGDYVCGWATGKTVRITAIGDRRFLHIDQSRDYEGVSTMQRPGFEWQLVKRGGNDASDIGHGNDQSPTTT